MQVGVEKPVAEHLVEECFGCFLQQRVDVMPSGDKRGAVVDPDASDAACRQHTVAGAPPIDPRYAKSGVAGEILGEFGGRRRLEA